MSDYAKKRISERMTGKKLSEAHRASISREIQRRWDEGIFNEVRNKKVSESNKGKKKSKSHAENISLGRIRAMKENPERFAYLKDPKFNGHRYEKGHPPTLGSKGMKWYNDGITNYLCLPENKKDKIGRAHV